MSARILVVEDERHLAEGIQANLEAEGYDVAVVGDGAAALDVWREGGLDLIVLDVMLPKLDGFTVCERIREGGGREPVLFLTAKNTADDRVRGLEAGGDDYLGKPFNLRELLLRVRGILRRQSWYDATPAGGPTATVAGKRVDFSTYQVTDGTGFREHLAQKEAMILKALVERPGETVSREEILEHVWGYDVFPSSRTIERLVGRLRRVFEADPASPRYLHTVAGIGYRYDP